jgi:uncharacterized protein (TIGR02265 family)
MGKSKGSDIVCMRKCLKNAGEKTEQRFLDQLTPNEVELYKKLLTSMWIPVETATKFLCLGSMALFPQETESQALFKLGILQAQEDINGIYRVFFKVLSVKSLIKKMPMLWRAYNDTGSNVVKVISKKHVVFTLTDYSDYPIAQFDNICGYIHACMEMVNAKNIKITPDLTNPNAWKFKIVWE